MTGEESTRRAFLSAGVVGLSAIGVSSVVTDTTSERDTDRDRPGEWDDSVPNLPEPMADPGGAAIDGTLYVYGGFYPSATDEIASTYAYDPNTDDGWRERESVPTGRWLPCGVATDDRLYSFGGRAGGAPSDRIFAFDPDDGWTDLTASAGSRCPEPAWGMQGVYDENRGRIWVAGGGIETEDGKQNTTRLWTFDPADDAISDDYAPLPDGRHVFTMGLLDRSLYVVSGYQLDGDFDAATWAYDIEADEWRRRTPAPLNVLGATRNQPVVDGKLYVTHGLNWGERADPKQFPHKRVETKTLRARYFYATCFEYDPTRETVPGVDPWRRMADAAVPRDGVANAVVDGTLYVVGGRATERPQPKGEAAVEAFAPD